MVTVFYLNYDILSYFYFLVVLHAIERPDLLYSLFAYFNFINSLYCNCYKNQEDSVADMVQNSAFTENSDGIRGLEMIHPEVGRYTKECMRFRRISSSTTIKL